MSSASADPILAAFDRLTRRRPSARLIHSGSLSTTVGEVAALARRIRELLEAERLEPGSVIGLAAVNGAGFLAGFLALRQLGCAALLLDPATHPTERARIVTAMAGSGLLSCDSVLPQDASALGWRRFEPKGAAAIVAPDIAVIKVTSGSTASQRGVLTPAASLIADDLALTLTMGLDAEDRILAAIPMSHSYGLSSVAIPALVRGTTLVLPAGRGPFAAIQTAQSAGVTFLPTVPGYLAALLRTSSPPGWPPTLRLVITAGEPLAPETAWRFRQAYGRGVHVFYGCSETGGICFDREGTAGERGTVGTPVEGVEVGLTSAAEATVDHQRLWVRSAATARGYHPQADESLSGGRFVTSDLAEIRHGEVVLRGRLGDLVIVNGLKVNPREVEALLAQMPEVLEVAVLGVELPGRRGKVLRAVLASRSSSLSYDEIRRWCASRLAAHKIPRSLIVLPDLPRTERGKVDREALANLSPRLGSGFSR